MSRHLMPRGGTDVVVLEVQVDQALPISTRGTFWLNMALAALGSAALVGYLLWSHRLHLQSVDRCPSSRERQATS